MVGLMDVVLATGKVDVNGTKVDVRALSGGDLAAIFARFPDIASMMSGKGGELGAAALIKFLPEAIPAVIVAGVGLPDDPAPTEEESEKLEARVARFSMEDQVELVAEIIKLTFRSGIGPFGERLRSLMRPGEAATNGAPTGSLTSPRPSPKP